jgi:hypothetical protein
MQDLERSSHAVMRQVKRVSNLTNAHFAVGQLDEYFQDVVAAEQLRELQRIFAYTRVPTALLPESSHRPAAFPKD